MGIPRAATEAAAISQFPQWPVDFSVDGLFEQLLVTSLKSPGIDSIPFIWFWPQGASSCAIMTHDVETERGRRFCKTLMDINDSFGIKSSFQVIPEQRYQVSPEYLDSIRNRGFEVAVHDLNHDGHLYRDREQFLKRAEKINPPPPPPNPVDKAILPRQTLPS